MRMLEGNSVLSELSATLHARTAVRDRKRKQRALDKVLGRRADGHTIRPVQW